MREVGQDDIIQSELEARERGYWTGYVGALRDLMRAARREAQRRAA